MITAAQNIIDELEQTKALETAFSRCPVSVMLYSNAIIYQKMLLVSEVAPSLHVDRQLPTYSISKTFIIMVSIRS